MQEPRQSVIVAAHLLMSLNFQFLNAIVDRFCISLTHCTFDLTHTSRLKPCELKMN